MTSRHEPEQVTTQTDVRGGVMFSLVGTMENVGTPRTVPGTNGVILAARLEGES
jgi:hypothetical protein